MTASLGLRCNNPGNLRTSAVAWKGQAGSVEGFCRFTSAVWGLRAIAVTLRHYEKFCECPQTVRGIITRWAPGVENDTAAYIQDVCERLGVEADMPINVSDPDVCQGLLKAICWHENGQMPYPADLVAEAVAAG